ncbi:MAG: sigma-70 family RNA polymerase sigma factor [Spirochaetales bacterium]|nr:sigma-70 family RNA polymerase sigma factor [Spirochaetales bacterium]
MDSIGRIEQIYKDYAPSLVRRIKWYFPNDSFLVDDILHEIFISLIKKKMKLDLGERIFVYLHNAVRFKCLDIIKKNKKRTIIINSEIIDLVIDPKVHTEQAIVTKDYIKNILQFLKPKYRLLFMLRFINQYKRKDIAEMLNRPENTIKKQIQKIRSILQKSLERDLSNIKSDIKMIILDSCHSGAFIQAKGGSFYPPFLTTYKTSGYVYLTSCTADENSYESESIEYSLFTFSLLLGLRGAADSNNDGNITLNELYQFVFNETLNQAEKITSQMQHPSYKIKLTGTGDVIITNIHQNTSRLIIKPEIRGNVIIKDSFNNIIVDIEKRNEKPLEIFLIPGEYFFSVYFKDKKYSKKFRIKINDIQEIASLKDLDRIDQNKNGVKGETADRISIHLTGVYAIPLSENLNTEVKGFAGCSLQAGFTLLEFGLLIFNVTAAGSCLYHPEINSASNVKSMFIATGVAGGGIGLDFGSIQPFLNIAGGVSFSVVDSRFYDRTFILPNPSLLGERRWNLGK